MTTEHKIYFDKAQKMSSIKDSSVDLVITSPPYPMIEMWDEIMSKQNPKIKDALEGNRPKEVFDLMHNELDAVWKECYRVIKDGGFLCINIGDATRTINGHFELFNNHTRITSYCIELGFSNLPNVIWRKQTNAPNKFMGSGMLPCGAYITLEHEYILVFRKGEKRPYRATEEKSKRRQSSFFWEERNCWFSDVWEVKGTKQKINKSDSRERSAAFPLEIPYRLICMYSQMGDYVLDPFMGIGTTAQAAILLGRNSLGYEIDKALSNNIVNNIQSIEVRQYNMLIQNRYNKHIDFIKERAKSHGTPKHINNYLGCPVMTGQEEDLELHYLTDIAVRNSTPLTIKTTYEDVSVIMNPPITDGRFF